MRLPRQHRKKGPLRMYLYRGVCCPWWYRISFTRPRLVAAHTERSWSMFHGEYQNANLESYWSNRGSSHDFDAKFWERAGGPKLKRGGGPILITVDLKKGLEVRPCKRK